MIHKHNFGMLNESFYGCTKCFISTYTLRILIVTDEYLHFKVKNAIITEDDMNELIPCTLNDDEAVIKEIIE